MNLHLLVVVFLIFGIVFAWSSDDKNSGIRRSSKKKNTIRLRANIANPFFQLPVTFSSVESNFFLLQFYGNKSGSQTIPIISLSEAVFRICVSTVVGVVSIIVQLFHKQSCAMLLTTSTTLDTHTEKKIGQVSNTALVRNQSLHVAFSSGNPFLNFRPGSRIDTALYNASRPSAPVTQAPYGLSSYPLESPRPQRFTYQRSFSKEVRPSATPSLLNLILTRTKTRSELKCEEYLREVGGTTAVVALGGTSSNVTKVENTCGNVNRLVVDGSEATIGEFPHMVALGRRNPDGELIFMCGGTLISHSWILTAAHCTYGPDGGLSEARLGIHLLSDQQSGVTIAIKRTLRYPEFRPPAMYSDIALIELNSTVTFSELIRPVCLYQQFDVPTAAWASGWGATEFGGDVASDALQKVQLNFVNNLWCTMQYNNSGLPIEVPHGIRPSMICAGDPHGGWRKDTCQGDSGGPLQIIHPNYQCLFQQIGIISFGMRCGYIDIPSVYTRVSYYLHWIESIVWP